MGDALNVLMVSDFYLPKPGGIAEHVHHLTLELRRRGHNVHIATGNAPRNMAHHDPPFVHRMGRTVPIPINKSMGQITLSPLLMRRLKRLMTRIPFDVVHCHPPLALSLPLAALTLSESVNIGTFHAAHESQRLYELFRGVLQRYAERLHGRIAVSTVARDSVARYFPGQYRIIPNGIDVHRFRPDLPPIPWMRDRRFFTLLFVGRFEPRKGLRFLLQAVALLRHRIPELRLVVVGDGPLKQYYRQFIHPEVRDRILFVGQLPRELLPRYYVSADVYVSPATGAESFGIVLLEAMASGTPVVASRIPGYAQVLEEGRQGLFAEPESPRSIARAVETLYRHPELRRRMAAEGRRTVLEKYSWEQVAQQVETFYREVLREVRGAKALSRRWV